MRKSRNTSISERSSVQHDMWRKKVDNSLFRWKGTVIPRWVASKWNLEKHFPNIKGVSRKNDELTKTKLVFTKKTYKGNLTCTFPKKRANKVHRLWVSDELLEELKKVFVMSHMRDIESALRGMVIRSYASLFTNKSNIESMKILTYCLANDKIDK